MFYKTIDDYISALVFITFINVPIVTKEKVFTACPILNDKF